MPHQIAPITTTSAATGLATPSLLALGAAWLTGKAFGLRTGAQSRARTTTTSTPDPSAPRPTPDAARERVDLRQPLRAMSQAHGPMLAQRGIHLDLFLPDDALTITAVPGELSQLIAHILDVAAGALRQDTTLHVLARAEGQHAVLNWRDGSVGAPRLSHAFATADSSTAERVLACQTIAARHGARIYAAPSPLGDGCLTVRFPLHGRRDEMHALTFD